MNQVLSAIFLGPVLSLSFFFFSKYKSIRMAVDRVYILNTPQWYFNKGEKSIASMLSLAYIPLKSIACLLHE